MSEANGEDVVLDNWAKSKTKAILESMTIKGEIPDDDWPPARVMRRSSKRNVAHSLEKDHENSPQHVGKRSNVWGSKGNYYCWH
jgi:hypothetical protein